MDNYLSNWTVVDLTSGDFVVALRNAAAVIAFDDDEVVAVAAAAVGDYFENTYL